MSFLTRFSGEKSQVLKKKNADKETLFAGKPEISQSSRRAASFEMTKEMVVAFF